MKKFYPCSILLFCVLILVPGCTVAPVTSALFNPNVSVEEDYEEGNYLIRNDGSKVYGKKIKGMYGIAVKDYISIDGQKFKPSEIKGYRDGKFFYGRHNSDYNKRVVHGAINIYVGQEIRRTTSNATNITRNETRTYNYYQKGENGELILFGDADIKYIVRGCAKAEAMADKSPKELRQALRKNPGYLNDIFEVYNKECNQ